MKLLRGKLADKLLANLPGLRLPNKQDERTAGVGMKEKATRGNTKTRREDAGEKRDKEDGRKEKGKET